MRDAFIESLSKIAENDKDIFLITGDLGFGVLDNFSEKFPSQFLNVGVAEQNMTGIAVGLALSGYKVFTYSIANFTTLRCLEQIRNDACYHNANVNVVSIGGGFGYGALGMSHHATEDLSIMRSLPNIEVIAPGDDFETKEATKYVTNSNKPSYLRLERASHIYENDLENSFAYGKIRQIREGNDIAVFCSGGVTKVAMNAAKTLSKQNISLSIYSVHSLKAIDVNAVAKVFEKYSGVVTLEENNLIGGLGSAISEICLDNRIYPKSFKRMGLKDIYSSVVGSQEYLRDFYNLGEEDLIINVKKIMDK
ncbi:MAG: transketolase [Gammaproteobacteria bacterium]|nr:transketolase [Gammaproteobacteria bacterium]|tara:strand:+ start:253 stop:1176 length:924 start_codon:yes stop_codon:yes gene_type:complete